MQAQIDFLEATFYSFITSNKNDMISECAKIKDTNYAFVFGVRRSGCDLEPVRFCDFHPNFQKEIVKSMNYEMLVDYFITQRLSWVVGSNAYPNRNDMFVMYDGKTIQLATRSEVTEFAIREFKSSLLAHPNFQDVQNDGL